MICLSRLRAPSILTMRDNCRAGRSFADRPGLSFSRTDPPTPSRTRKYVPLGKLASFTPCRRSARAILGSHNAPLGIFGGEPGPRQQVFPPNASLLEKESGKSPPYWPPCRRPTFETGVPAVLGTVITSGQATGFWRADLWSDAEKIVAFYRNDAELDDYTYRGRWLRRDNSWTEMCRGTRFFFFFPHPNCCPRGIISSNLGVPPLGKDLQPGNFLRDCAAEVSRQGPLVICRIEN